MRMIGMVGNGERNPEFVSLKAARNVAAEPTSCPGHICPKKSEECDTCLHSEVYVAHLASLARTTAFNSDVVMQTRNDAKREVGLIASAARGVHAVAARISGRIRF